MGTVADRTSTKRGSATTTVIIIITITIGGITTATWSSSGIRAGGVGGMAGGTRPGVTIYGYDGAPPDEVVASVQSELQRLGYFTYAVDGKLGPLTRSAINRYQRDNRLPITGTIDPATAGALGLQ